MKKNEKKKWLIIISIISFVLLILLLFAINGVFSKTKPAVLVYVSTSSTKIEGFALSKTPGVLECIACTGFTAKVKVYYNGAIICDSQNSLSNLGGVSIPVFCNDSIKNYENQTVYIEAVGVANPLGNTTIQSTDNETLELKFSK